MHDFFRHITQAYHPRDNFTVKAVNFPKYLDLIFALKIKD